MFDPNHIISRLTEGQKIRLLTDIQSLADPEFKALGVPRVRCIAAQEISGGDYPAPAVLARSWDKALLSDIAEDNCRSLAETGIDHVFLPEAKARLTAFGRGLSEDPVFAGDMVGACLEGANRAGLSASIAGYGFLEQDTAALGGDPTARMKYTFMDMPYAHALKKGNCVAIVNETGDKISLDQDFGRVLCRYADGPNTVKTIEDGQICIEGSAPALQSALHKYRRLKTAIQHGQATTSELLAACADGSAMSEEVLNEAVRRLLEFAHTCSEHTPSSEGQAAAHDELVARALRSSVILLENRPVDPKAEEDPKKLAKTRRFLPLKKGSADICLLGDMIAVGGASAEDATKLLQEAGHTVIGYAKGYDRVAERNDHLLEEAVRLASTAKTVIVFLGIDEDREKRWEKNGRITLPANQLALCDELSRMNKNVIAVMSSGLVPDMSFLTSVPYPFAAVLWAPLDAPGGLAAVVDILTGKSNPSGRLPVTLCAREACPEVFREDRPIGPFVGYRYFDSMGYGAMYPFGHGLSYTSFTYSHLKVSDGQVTFTVTNTGKRAGTEIAQIYVGAEGSAVLRPKKELMSFARVELAPGKKQTVTVPLELPAIRTEEGTLVTENARYVISVGASVSDIRLQASLTAGQDQLPSDGERIEDYLSSVSNIYTQHYTMEAECTPMKSLRNILFGIAALILAISVKVYDIQTAADTFFLDIIAGVLAAGAVLMFVLEIIDKVKQNAAERAKMESFNAAALAQADAISVPSSEELFAAEDAREFAQAYADNVATTAAEDEFDLYAEVDKKLTFGDAAAELIVLAREKGIILSETTAKSIFAAISSSNLIVVRDMSDKHFEALIALLGEYFACHTEVDTVDESYRSESDVLFTGDGFYSTVPRNALNSLLAAQHEPGKIHLAALADVDPATMSSYFVPFARFAHAPKSGYVINCKGGYGEDVSYRIPENLWFVLNLKKGVPVGSLPDYVAEIATVNSWSFDMTGNTSETHSEFRHFGYGQIEYLCDRLRSNFEVDEDTWKKIDRLEAFGARYGEFHIGNKLWLGMELYMAVLMSQDVAEPTARDEALAVKLMPSLISVLSGKIPRDDRGLGETLDAIFGEDNTALCRKVVKESGTDLI